MVRCPGLPWAFVAPRVFPTPPPPDVRNFFHAQPSAPRAYIGICPTPHAPNTTLPPPLVPHPWWPVQPLCVSGGGGGLHPAWHMASQHGACVLTSRYRTRAVASPRLASLDPAALR